MGINFDRWTLLKLLEVVLVLVCLVFKRVTDDEASRVFLYLQKISREWSLLNNITWSRVGAALADATYGGYLIITFALFIGRLFGELPTKRRISEYIFLGLGTILFVVLGSLSFAALDSVPQALVDNAAIVGTVSLVTAGLFLLDMAGPKAKNVPKEFPKSKRDSKQLESRSIPQQVYDIEKQLEKSEKKHLDTFDKPKKRENGVRNGEMKERQENGRVGGMMEMETKKGTNGYQQMKDDFPKRFGIYGKDVTDGSETDDTDLHMPPEWNPIRRFGATSERVDTLALSFYGNYDIVSSPLVLPRQVEMEEYRPPSRPGDPGYVQYTAQHWGKAGPRHRGTVQHKFRCFDLQELHLLFFYNHKASWSCWLDPKLKSNFLVYQQ